MPRLLVHVEGQTEEDFVNEILREHLVRSGYHSVEARLLGNARLRRQRGGIRPWPSVRNEIANHLREDPGCVATTMVDYYALPKDDPGGWPGRIQASTLPAVLDKAGAIHEALSKDLAITMGPLFQSDRFVPFVLVHEFEGLLFSDCSAFSRGIYRPDLETRFQEIRDAFETPEDINDSALTAPSKRVEALVAGYQKPLLGVLAAIEIGLTRIRTECPHFDGWIRRLESLVI